MKKILLLVLILLIGLGIFGYRKYNQPHEDLSKGKADISLTAEKIMADYEANEEEANKLYLEKTIDVKGQVVSMEKADGGVTVVLGNPDAMSAVRCEFLPESASDLSNVKSGQEIVVRGKCAGSLMDVIFQRCILVK